MAINSYDEYQSLPRVVELKAGDILLKKVFPETRKTATEWGITAGQRLFSSDKKTAGLFSRNKFTIAFNGSHTSEHAAVAISSNEIAEAVGEGVISVSIQGRRDERYCVYRCKEGHRELSDVAAQFAKGLSDAYHHTITKDPGIRKTTGGAYSVKGALASNFRSQQFQQSSTEIYLSHIIDYVYGLRNDRPNMFCSEFAMACYEAASVAAFGKTAFGTSPIGMSPMMMEDVLNGSDKMSLVGKYDSENDALFSAVEKGLRSYGKRWHWKKSRQSTSAKEVLHNLLLIGDNDYLLAAVAAYFDLQPNRPCGVKCKIDSESRLKPDSSLYKDLKNALKPTGFFNFP